MSRLWTWFTTPWSSTTTATGRLPLLAPPPWRTPKASDDDGHDKDDDDTTRRTRPVYELRPLLHDDDDDNGGGGGRAGDNGASSAAVVSSSWPPPPPPAQPSPADELHKPPPPPLLVSIPYADDDGDLDELLPVVRGLTLAAVGEPSLVAVAGSHPDQVRRTVTALTRQLALPVLSWQQLCERCRRPPDEWSPVLLDLSWLCGGVGGGGGGHHHRVTGRLPVVAAGEPIDDHHPAASDDDDDQCLWTALAQLDLTHYRVYAILPVRDWRALPLAVSARVHTAIVHRLSLVQFAEFQEALDVWTTASAPDLLALLSGAHIRGDRALLWQRRTPEHLQLWHRRRVADLAAAQGHEHGGGGPETIATVHPRVTRSAMERLTRRITWALPAAGGATTNDIDDDQQQRLRQWTAEWQNAATQLELQAADDVLDGGHRVDLAQWRALGALSRALVRAWSQTAPRHVVTPAPPLPWSAVAAGGSAGVDDGRSGWWRQVPVPPPEALSHTRPN